MNRVLISIFMTTMVAALSVAAQQTLPQALSTPDTEITLHGRIVLYDWQSHEIRMAEDFVVKTLERQNNNIPYARIIYKPRWGWDAPAAEPKDVLDRWAFVGRGASWIFSVHAPRTDEERAACSTGGSSHKYEDEDGSGEIPRFVPTPGAGGQKIPPVQSLPCFILNKGGLTRASSGLSDHDENDRKTNN